MKIGVIGAGMIGRSVAQHFAQNNHSVVLIDISKQILEEALNQIRREIKLSDDFSLKSSETVNHANISISLDYSAVSDADFIIESTPEKLDIKTTVYQCLESVANRECVFLVNTSCISITKLGALTTRADKVIGVHFMSPVSKNNFAEVIKGTHTTNKTIEKTLALLKDVGIATGIINSGTGFIWKHLPHLFLNETNVSTARLDRLSTPSVL
jgi:3-hydroxybutyryl-CoA dehydrogenase